MNRRINERVWHKNSRGFWLMVCIDISVFAGWLMMYLRVVS